MFISYFSIDDGSFCIHFFYLLTWNIVSLFAEIEMSFFLSGMKEVPLGWYRFDFINFLAGRFYVGFLFNLISVYFVFGAYILFFFFQIDYVFVDMQ